MVGYRRFDRRNPVVELATATSRTGSGRRDELACLCLLGPAQVYVVSGDDRLCCLNHAGAMNLFRSPSAVRSGLARSIGFTDIAIGAGGGDHLCRVRRRALVAARTIHG